MAQINGEEIVIGVDFGLSHTSAAYFLNGEVHHLLLDGATKSKQFWYSNPDDDKPFSVGNEARLKALKQPKYGFSGVARLLANDLKDVPDTRHCFSDAWPMQCTKVEVTEEKDELVLVTETEGATRVTSPEDMCRSILDAVVSEARNTLGGSGASVAVVVTIRPGCSKRHRTKLLGIIDDLRVPVAKLLCEPIAAALCAYSRCSREQEHLALVYDFGGSSFTATVLRVMPDNITIVASEEDLSLGASLIGHVKHWLTAEVNKAYDILVSQNPRLLGWVHQAAEDAIRTVMEKEEAVISNDLLTLLYGHRPVVLTRENFNSLAEEVVAKTIAKTELCLEKAGVAKSDLSRIIMSGGGSRHESFYKAVSDFCSPIPLHRCDEPEMCTARGAAIQGAVLSKCEQQKTTTVLEDVLPLSLVRVFEQFRTTKLLLPKGRFLPGTTKIPAYKPYMKTSEGKSYRFSLYEGERKEIDKNKHLATLSFCVRNSDKGQVDITVSVPLTGLVTISAEQNGRVIESESVLLLMDVERKEYIESVLKDAEQHRSSEEMLDADTACRAQVLSYSEEIMFALEKDNLLQVPRFRRIYDICHDTNERIRSNIYYFTPKECIDAYRNLQYNCGWAVDELNIEVTDHNPELLPAYAKLIAATS